MVQNSEYSSGSGQNTFQRLQSQLAGLIAATTPGERLLSEPELAKQLHVSRATLREAMRTFEGQGLIRRRQGVGTFVVAHPQVIDTGLELLESIESLATRMSLDVSMGDLRVSHIEADSKMAKIFKIEPGTTLIKVSRVIYTDDRPVAYLEDIVPPHILPEAAFDQSFTGSVLDFLLRQGGSALTNSMTEVQAVIASSRIARALEIQRGDVLLKFVASLLTDTGEVIDYSLSYFLPGYFRFHVVRRVGGVVVPAAPVQ
jgi:GntR family transcriptional regulator